jgi:hypothetical protein
MYDKHDWRGLAQSLIKISYDFDLSYFYLAAAANGLGLKDAYDKYLIKAKELALTEEKACSKAKMIKCSGFDIENAIGTSVVSE